ncbi:alpha-2-macroglobulin receptor-associated protein [Pyxicephalus adspersus]|uniref:Alpha-2-macroglobulin receptor-associated protein n=1 Tax=Pyxicephalus adspersus TaxID=30357 RepID=A0AAV3AV42_PYXAD|nr:TPA: hypothetical protein GDO54_009589 [Pyxicephalus adspersus]
MSSAVCRWLLLCSLTILGVQADGGGGKYSREKNENRPEGVEFRIQKLNQVWDKAQRLQLSPVKLAELHSDLKIQEKDELNWKKIKAEGLDDDGEKEAKLRRSLNVILAKYGLDGKKKAQTEDSNYLKEGTENDVLNDPRLEKLWNKIHKNVISPDEHDLKTDFLHGKHADLKEKLHSINQGYERLRKLSHEGYAGGRDFNEPRVNDLWDMAKNANFSETELESFKEELKHFETKVEKHQHYQKQLEISHEKLKHVVETGDKEHIKKSKEKHNALTEKIKEMGYKVKKHLQDLSSRISKNGLSHNEL